MTQMSGLVKLIDLTLHKPDLEYAEFIVTTNVFRQSSNFNNFQHYQLHPTLNVGFCRITLLKCILNTPYWRLLNWMNCRILNSSKRPFDQCCRLVTIAN